MLRTFDATAVGLSRQIRSSSGGVKCQKGRFALCLRVSEKKHPMISFLSLKTTILSILSNVERRFNTTSWTCRRIVEGNQTMKRCLLALSVLACLASVGCHHNLRRDCNQCGGALGCRPCTVGWQRGGTDYQRFLDHSRYPHHAQAAPGGPQGATAAYPYYTVRGPRDFLVDNPPSIGR